MKLPIDLIPRTGISGQKFRWWYDVNTPEGVRSIEHVGTLPPAVENAVAELIDVAKQQHKEIEALKAKLVAAANRIGAQSEILSKKAEKVEVPVKKK